MPSEMQPTKIRQIANHLVYSDAMAHGQLTATCHYQVFEKSTCDELDSLPRSMTGTPT